jgi:hypothetical protein
LVYLDIADSRRAIAGRKSREFICKDAAVGFMFGLLALRVAVLWYYYRPAIWLSVVVAGRRLLILFKVVTTEHHWRNNLIQLYDLTRLDKRDRGMVQLLVMDDACADKR